MTCDPLPAKHAQAVVVECELEQSPAKVWRALTVPEILASWLLPNDIRPEVGARFTFDVPPEEGPEGMIECEILEAEPNRRLRYSWQRKAAWEDTGDPPLDTMVTFELVETLTGGTYLRLIHDGFPLRLDQAVSRLSLARHTVSIVQLVPRCQQARRRRADSARHAGSQPTDTHAWAA